MWHDLLSFVVVVHHWHLVAHPVHVRVHPVLADLLLPLLPLLPAPVAAPMPTAAAAVAVAGVVVPGDCEVSKVDCAKLTLTQLY